MNTSELTNVIECYLSDKKPCYAIMINGPWGSGKTTFIKDTLKKINQKKLYVSLYGMNSLEDFRDRIFTSLSSIEGVSEAEISKVGSFVKSVTSILGDSNGGSIGSIASTIGSTIKARLLSNINPEYCLVFDDLERATCSKSEVLSFINEFIEHQNLRVIILCAEDVIEEPDYNKVKEKTVLFTNRISRSLQDIADIAISPDLLLPEFIIQKSKDELIRLLENIHSENLRTIKYAMLCYSRLLNAIDKNGHEKKNDVQQVELIRPCLSYAIGHREMGLSTDILEDFSSDLTGLYMKYSLSRKKQNEMNVEPVNDNDGGRAFYNQIATKDNNSINFPSVFKLICLGHLDSKLLINDISRWSSTQDKNINVVTDFKVTIKDRAFEDSLKAILDEIKSKKLIIESANELYKLVSHLHFFIDNQAISYDMNDFKSEIVTFIEYSIDNQKYSSTELNFFVKSSEANFLADMSKLISEKLEQKSDLLKAKDLSGYLIKAMTSDEPNELYRTLNKYQLTPYICENLTEEIFNLFINSSNSNKFEFTKYLNGRYNAQNIMQYLSSEIDALKIFRKLTDVELSSRQASLTMYHLKQLKSIVDSALALPELG